MADLDTRSKRASSWGTLRPYIITPPLPDGTIGQGDRQHIAYTYSGISASAASEALLALKSLVLEIASGLGLTLMPSGNTLPISIVTQVPTAAPPGNKGVCFRVSGGALVIYAWDGSAWRAN